jgi:hypothetical protein
MQKVDLWAHARPQREVVERTFQADGDPITLRFRRPDAADMCRAAEVAKRLVEDYITGSDDRPAAEFWDGIKLSEQLCMTAATAEQMQPEQVYSAEEFILMQDRRPTDWPEINALIREQSRHWREASGKSPAVRAEKSAAPPSILPTNSPT